MTEDIKLLNSLGDVNKQPHILPFYNTDKRRSDYELSFDHPMLFEHDNLTYGYVIRKGVRYDGASIPWIVKPIIRLGRDGTHRNATLGHDVPYLLEKEPNLDVILGKEKDECIGSLYAFLADSWVKTELQLSKKDVDDIFFQLIGTTEGAHISKFQRWAVRTGFNTPIARRYWRNSQPNHIINPLSCKP